MALFNMKCANCGASIQMDDSQQIGFCMYCGNKYIVKEEIQRIIIEHQGQVRIDRDEEICNLLTRAKEKIEEYYKIGNYYDEDGIKPIVNNYLEKVLDLQPDNKEARELKSQLLNLKSVYKATLTITRVKQKFYNGAADVIINGEQITVWAGKTITIELPIGLYDVTISLYTLLTEKIRFYLKDDVNILIKYNHFTFPISSMEVDVQGADLLSIT